MRYFISPYCTCILLLMRHRSCSLGFCGPLVRSVVAEYIYVISSSIAFNRPLIQSIFFFSTERELWWFLFFFRGLWESSVKVLKPPESYVFRENWDECMEGSFLGQICSAFYILLEGIRKKPPFKNNNKKIEQCLWENKTRRRSQVKGLYNELAFTLYY